jgi:hypothetical protein
MTQSHQSRDQQTVQAQRIIAALLAALPAIEERRQWAVRFHTFLRQRCHRARPVQDARLFLRSLEGTEENKDDHRRGTHKSRRRRVPQQRL